MTEIEEMIEFSACSETKHKGRFIKIIAYLQSLMCFEDILNVVLTLCLQKRLSFNICTSFIQDNKQGLCETIVVPLTKRIFGKLLYKNKYQVSIKKLKHSLIMHEISHAIEKELKINLSKVFVPSVLSDLDQLKKSNIVLAKNVYDIMVKDLRLYNSAQHDSEIFARYFELIAMTQEVSGEKSIYISDIKSLFKKTSAWVEECLKPQLKSLTDQRVKDLSIKIKKRDVLGSKVFWGVKNQPKNIGKWSDSVKSNFE